MSSCRFPKLEECAHFHYELVEIGSLKVSLMDENIDSVSSNITTQSFIDERQLLSQTSGFKNDWFIMKIGTDFSDQFLIKRSFDNMRLLDEMLHRCVFDRKMSLLRNLSSVEIDTLDTINSIIHAYFDRFSSIANDSITCGKILTWFQLDNKGRRLALADTEIRKSINTPAVGAAYGVRKYTAQAPDEISIELGDMISVIDMPNPTESLWWRGKKSHLQKSQYEVGFFPQNCVATIGDKIPRNLTLLTTITNKTSEETSPTKPVLKKHGKLIAFFRSFILSRPSRRGLKQRGIYRERVFSCDLGEHLLNSGQKIPIILKCCAEFLEKNGIIDGIYRLSGVTSNIQKLRRAFDEERIPDMNCPDMIKDIHAVSSVLKMYFRELPNPLCTYQLYDHFVEAIQKRNDEAERLRLVKKTVLMLPPPHYRTLRYLAMHLNKISKYSSRTGMTDKNLAIVWAPNLLRSPAIELGGISALKGVGIQAVVTEFLIRNYVHVFEFNETNEQGLQDNNFEVIQDFSSTTSDQISSITNFESSSSMIEKTKYLNCNRTNLISLEEARERKLKMDNSMIWNKENLENYETNLNDSSESSLNSKPLYKKYHTLLPAPRTWQKRKTTSWKSLFTKNIKTSDSTQGIKFCQHANKNKLCVLGEEVTTLSKNIIERSEVDDPEQFNSSKILCFNPGEIYARSSSLDSVKTVQCHSRSMSHDSYFGNVLQSPILNLNNFCCKELTELVINFDREEPEMRIFSESESLLSSPKLSQNASNIKEKTCCLKNFTHSNSNICDVSQQSNLISLIGPSTNQYILDDHLSDIEFIDSFTPEHSNKSKNVNKKLPSKNNLYSNHEAQIETFSKDVKCTRSFSSQDIKFLENQSTLSRYSYPNLQTNYSIFNDDKCNLNICSYMPDIRNLKTISSTQDHYNSLDLEFQPKCSLSGIHKKKNLKLHYDTKLRHIKSSSTDTIFGNFENEFSNKENLRSMSSTALWSSQSARYTLFMLDPCSEPCTTINTPIGIKCILNKIEEENCKLKKKEDRASEFYHQLENRSNVATEKDVLKKQLYLDLNSVASGSENLTSFNFCNNSNLTVASDNTSQSLTPSEFDYLKLTRKSNEVSSENSPNTEYTEFVESNKETTKVLQQTNILSNYSFNDNLLRTWSVNYDKESESLNSEKKYCNENCVKKKYICDDDRNESSVYQKASKNYEDIRQIFVKPTYKSVENNGEIHLTSQLPDMERCNISISHKESFSKKTCLSVKEIATKFEVGANNKEINVCKKITPILHSIKKKIEKSEYTDNNENRMTSKNVTPSKSLDEKAFNLCINTDKKYRKSLQNFNESKNKSVEISLPKILNSPKPLLNDHITFANVKKSVQETTNSDYKTVLQGIEKNIGNLNPKATNDLLFLNGVKLDRERIERIKEQRRNQLSEKSFNGNKVKSQELYESSTIVIDFNKKN